MARRLLLACALAAGFPAAAAAAWSPVHRVAQVNGFVVAPAVSADGRGAIAMTDYGPRGSRALVALAKDGRWQRPRTVRASRHELFDPAVAFSADGSAHIAWLRAIRLDRLQVVETRTIDRAGRTGPLWTLSPEDQRAVFPTVAGGPGSAALVAWMRDDYDMVATEPGGAITSLFDRRLFTTAISYLPDGGAVVLGHAFEPGGVRVRLRPRGGDWGPPIALSGERMAREPDLAVGRDGTIAVAWAQFTENGYRIQLRVRPPGGEFGPTLSVVPHAGEARGPALAVLPRGKVLVAWAAAARRGAFLLRAEAVDTALVDNDGSVGQVERVTDPGAALDQAPQLVADADGDAVIAWTDRAAGRRVGAAIRSAAGTITRPRFLSRGRAYWLGLVGNARGDALLAWSRDRRRGIGAAVEARTGRF